MVWVKSEYAEELAVLSAWLTALIPWSVSVSIGEIGGGSLVEFHFPFLLLRWILGVDVPGANPLVLFPWEAIDYYSNAPGPLPFAVWTVGAVVVAAAVLFSFGMYLAESRFREMRVDPVVLMGGLILLAAVLHTVAIALLQFGALPIEGVATDRFPGIQLPVGVLFQYAFAYTLLRVERVTDPVETGEGDDPDVDGSSEPDVDGSSNPDIDADGAGPPDR